MAEKSKRGGPRPGSGRPKTGRDDVAVKIDRAVAARARYVADMRGLTLVEYLTEVVRPVVDRDFRKLDKSNDAEA